MLASTTLNKIKTLFKAQKEIISIATTSLNTEDVQVLNKSYDELHILFSRYNMLVQKCVLMLQLQTDAYSAKKHDSAIIGGLAQGIGGIGAGIGAAVNNERRNAQIDNWKKSTSESVNEAETEMRECEMQLENLVGSIFGIINRNKETFDSIITKAEHAWKAEEAAEEAAKKVKQQQTQVTENSEADFPGAMLIGIIMGIFSGILALYNLIVGDSEMSGIYGIVCAVLVIGCFVLGYITMKIREHKQ